jgi:hypothetical protein
MRGEIKALLAYSEEEEEAIEPKQKGRQEGITKTSFSRH